jgi:hypothetical protein
MSGNGFSNTVLEKHLADLRERQAHFKAAHPELGPMELRRAYWQQESRRRRGSERREINALIWLIKESQPFWET